MRARGEGGDRGWDGWMASMMQWTWVWAKFRREWRTGKPGVLQSMGSQRVRHDWAAFTFQCYEKFISIILLPTYLLHFFSVTFSLFILALEFSLFQLSFTFIISTLCFKNYIIACILNIYVYFYISSENVRTWKHYDSVLFYLMFFFSNCFILLLSF